MIEYKCLMCGKECRRESKGNFYGKYCSNACSGAHVTQRKVEAWLEGTELGYSGKAKQLKNFVRTYVHSVRGTQCSQCGWDGKHPIDGRSLTEIDHIDGDAENCTLDNLRVLCPNCHSMTPTFRARNKDSKRIRS